MAIATILLRLSKLRLSKLRLSKGVLVGFALGIGVVRLPATTGAFNITLIPKFSSSYGIS